MSLQIPGFIGHHSIGCSVRLVKSVLGKAYHVVEYFFGSLLRNSVANTSRDFHIAFIINLAVNEILFFLEHDIHLFLGHGTAHQIGTAIAVAAQVTYNLHNLLLIHKTAVGHIQNRRKGIVNISDVLWVFLVFYVFWNGIHRTRSVKGNSGNNVLKAGRLQVFHKLSHAAAFQLEHTTGVASCNHLVDRRIIIVHFAEIYFHAVVLPDELKSVAYYRQVSQPQKVHLKKPQLLDGGHCKLGSRALIGKIQRHILINRFFGNNHSGSMSGGMAGHSFYGLGHINYFFSLHVTLVHGLKLGTCGQCLVYGHIQLKRYCFGNGVGFGITCAHGSGNVSHRLFCLHGSEGYYLRNPALSVLSGNVVDYLLSALIAEVHINIGHADPFRIEETLKNQVIPDRVDVRNFKAVCHYGAGSRASSRSHHNAVCLCVIYEIPYNQEIFHISHGFYGAQLVVQSFVKLLGRVFPVPFAKSCLAELSEIGGIVLAVWSLEFRKMVFTEPEIEAAGVCNNLSIVHSLRKISKNLTHLLFALQVKFIVRKAHPVLIVKSGSGLNGKQHIMSLGIFLADIMNVIGSSKRNADLTGKLYHIVSYGHFLFKSLVLYFEVKVSGTEDFQKCFSLCLCSCVVLYKKAMLNISCQASGKSNYSIAVFSENIFINAGFVVVAFDVALGDYFYEILVACLIFCKENQMALMLVLFRILVGHPAGGGVHLTAYYWLDSLFFAFLVKVHNAEHCAVVCNGKAVHSQLLGPGNHIFYPCRSVKKAVLRMKMKVRKSHKNLLSFSPSVFHSTINFSFFKDLCVVK